MVAHLHRCDVSMLEDLGIENRDWREEWVMYDHRKDYPH